MESNFAVTKDQIDSEIGDFAGFGVGSSRGSKTWNAQQVYRIDEARRHGLDLFYRTQEVKGPDGRTLVQAAYDWSFLKPTSELSLASGTNTITLPDDFGGIQGDIIPVSTDGTAQWRVPIMGIGDIYRSEAQSPDQTGVPVACCVEWSKTTSAGQGQRARLRVYPTADDDYTFSVWYSILGDALTDAKPYAYGGAAHSQTIIAACKAAYEIHRDNSRGQMWAFFVERLVMSVEYDRKFKAQNLGILQDRSDDRVQRNFRGPSLSRVTYNGNPMS